MSGSTANQAPSLWLGEHVARITLASDNTIPVVRQGEMAPILPGTDLWDMWPLQLADGTTAKFTGAGSAGEKADGWTVWFVLSAPALPDPEARHGAVRIRLMTERDGQWRDCGNVLPDGLNPGSREWAGSALLCPNGNEVVLFYTVAGYPGEVAPSFAQRLFQTRGTLAIDPDSGAASITGWSPPAESCAADNRRYLRVTQENSAPGFIKGFRDPAHFRVPADGTTYLLFTGSLAQASSPWNGCIGVARATDATLEHWEILDPLISADGLSNEQERPHVLFRNGFYYLLWSTQRKVFALTGPTGPNGLYGMVARSMAGPWKPVNGTGLIAANPEEAPYQTYSWWVDADLAVWGFIDYPLVGAGDLVDDADWRRAHFGGTPAPRFHLVLEGETARVAPSATAAQG